MCSPQYRLYMKWLPGCLFEVECETTDLVEIKRVFLEPNLQLEVPLGLYVKTFPPETIGLELIFSHTMLPSPDLRNLMWWWDLDCLYELVFCWWFAHQSRSVRASGLRWTFITCVINLPCTFLPITWNCRIFIFILWSGMSYVRTLTIWLLLVYFVCAAGCHCFDSNCTDWGSISDPLKQSF